MVHKDKENNLQTTLYRKPTNHQSYLHAKSEHPSTLKNSIAYSQTLILKTICSTDDEYQRNCSYETKTFGKKNIMKMIKH